MILAWPIPRIGHDQAQYMATTHVQVNALGGAAGGHGRTGIQGGAIELHLEDDRGQAATDLIIHAQIGLEAATDTTQVIDNGRVRRDTLRTLEFRSVLKRYEMSPQRDQAFDRVEVMLSTLPLPH